MTDRTPWMAAILMILTGGDLARAEEREKQPLFKGVELYSCKGDKGQWLFALVVGTNREKTAEEVKNGKDVISGVADLGKALNRLAVSEQVFWVDRVKGFEFPPKETREEIYEAARKAEVRFHGPDVGGRESKPRLKGVELYSWKDDKGGWHFALLDGTNERKTAEQVRKARRQPEGVEDLIAALGCLAVGEQVSWSHPVEGFEFPSKEVRQQITEAA